MSDPPIATTFENHLDIDLSIDEEHADEFEPRTPGANGSSSARTFRRKILRFEIHAEDTRWCRDHPVDSPGCGENYPAEYDYCPWCGLHRSDL